MIVEYRRAIRTLMLCALLLLPPMASAQEVTRILPLGDSITHGGVGMASYRRALWHKLVNAGYRVDFVGSQDSFYAQAPPRAMRDFDLDHEGHWAWEAGEVAASIDDWLNAWFSGYTPDVVMMHLGTNDVDRDKSVSATLNHLAAIVESLRAANPAVTVLVAQIIPMRSRDTDVFNAALVPWVQQQSTAISPVLLVDQHSGYDPQTDNHDEYHPNALGEEKMARRWFASLQGVLPPPARRVAQQSSIFGEVVQLVLGWWRA